MGAPSSLLTRLLFHDTLHFMKIQLSQLTMQHLQRALEIRQKITALEEELGQLLVPGQPASIPPVSPPKKVMSAAARAKIAATQKARWAERKQKAAAPRKVSAPAAPAKRPISPAGLARIVAANKARWAKFRAQKKVGAAGSK